MIYMSIKLCVEDVVSQATEGTQKFYCGYTYASLKRYVSARFRRTCACPRPFQLDYIQRSTALFKLLDTDKNGLIDAIEFVCAIACASGELLVSLMCIVWQPGQLPSPIRSS